MDKTLEQLFQIEHETQLIELVTKFGLLHVVDTRGDTLRCMARAAHSLKGAARLVQREEIEHAAHELEDILNACPTSEEVSLETQGRITACLLRLGAKSHQVRVLSPATAQGGIPAQPDQGAAPATRPTNNVLHLSQESITELINLASEMAVSSKRLESLIVKQRRHGTVSDSFSDIEMEAQRALDLSCRLQSASYRLRLVPVQESMRALVPTVEQLALTLNKNIRIKVHNTTTLVDRELLRSVEPCLIQLIRNAVDHGLEAPEIRVARGKDSVGLLELSARRIGASVEVRVRDDGAGVDIEAIRTAVIRRGLHSSEAAQKLSADELLEFLFLPGFSTRAQVTDISGRGIGLDIVKSSLRELGGDVTIANVHGSGTTFTMRFPSTIASTRILIVSIDEALIGFPLTSVAEVISAASSEPISVGGNYFLQRKGDEDVVPVVEPHRTFGLRASLHDRPVEYYVVLSIAGTSCAIPVHHVVGEQEVVVHPLDERYTATRSILGVGSGVGDRIVTLVDPDQLVVVSAALRAGEMPRSGETPVAARQRILVVDDSITVRELERRILTSAGYECAMAVDGIEGLAQLDTGAFDLVITDIDMPRLDGFGFLSQLRAQTAATPVLVVSYKERAEDRERSLQLGADAYLSKGSFKDDTFLQTVQRLIQLHARRNELMPAVRATAIDTGGFR